MNKTFLNLTFNIKRRRCRIAKEYNLKRAYLILSIIILNGHSINMYKVNHHQVM